MSQAESPCLAIFDHDGVLVDSLAFHQAAWLELGRRANLPLTEAFIRETFGMTNPSIFRRLLGDAIDDAEIARLGDLKEVCYRDRAQGRIVLMPGVRELLDGLTAAGVLLAIGSSGPRANLELTVSSCGLEGRFASIAALEDIRARQARSRGLPDRGTESGRRTVAVGRLRGCSDRDRGGEGGRDGRGRGRDNAPAGVIAPGRCR